MEEVSIDISVVIPTYNRASLLAKLLEAWQEADKTTKYGYELIFSDDGSSDDTVATLKAHANRLPIIVLENEHGGAARARNAAIRRAQGERILMLGDDIFPNPQLVNCHVELSRQFGPDTAILGDIKWHPELKLNYLMHHITEVGHEQFSLNALQPGQYVDFRHFYTANISLDRQFLLSEPGLFDERFSKVNFEDAELGYRLANRGVHIRFEPEAWVYHYHDYTAEAFCNRQRIAGEMAVVFVRLHPELGDLFGVERTRDRYAKFRSSSLVGLPRLTDAPRNFDAIIKVCETYEYELPLAMEPEQKHIKLALSSLYVRLFRACFELGILNKLDPTRTDYHDYLRSVYFNTDGYWNLYLEATDAFRDLSEADRSLREIVLLSYADQTNAGMQIALANKEVELLRWQDAQAQTERELAATREELDRIKASYAWRVSRTVVYPARLIRNLTRRLTSTLLRRNAGNVPKAAEEQGQFPLEDGRVSS